MNLLTSCLIKQNITPKQGMIYFNPEDLWKIWEKEVKPPPPPPPPPEIPEKIEIEWEDEEELENELEVDNAEADQDKMMEMPEEEFEEAFMSVEKMPMLGDCKNEDCTQSEIIKFIARNVKYPEISKANGVEGRVILEFVVEKNGKVGRVKILTGVDKHVNKSAIQVIQQLPRFNPGKQLGKAVPVKYTLPIKYSLG